MKKRSVIVIVLLITAAASLVVKLRQKPQWRRPEIGLRFLSMTNDASGTKLAKFELRNIGSVAIDVSIPGFIDIGMRGGGYFGFTNVTLQPGASLETSVEAPMTQDRWRAEFLCSIPLNLMQKFKNTAAKHGLPVVPVGQVGTSVYSEYLPPNPKGTERTRDGASCVHASVLGPAPLRSSADFRHSIPSAPSASVVNPVFGLRPFTCVSASHLPVLCVRHFLCPLIFNA